MTLTDAGALVALLDADDPYHTACVARPSAYPLAHCSPRGCVSPKPCTCWVRWAGTATRLELIWLSVFALQCLPCTTPTTFQHLARLVAHPLWMSSAGISCTAPCQESDYVCQNLPWLPTHLQLQPGRLSGQSRSSLYGPLSASCVGELSQIAEPTERPRPKQHL